VRIPLGNEQEMKLGYGYRREYNVRLAKGKQYISCEEILY
jgi:hypothetical protein